MDAFFASVEQRDCHELRGRPVAVVQGPAGDERGRAVVAGASHEARKHGVRVGMTAKAALQRCADLVVLPLDFDRYRSVSQQLHAILGDFSPRIESLALDRCWVDLTEREGLQPRNEAGLSSAASAARRIRDRVRGELGLTCSIGVAPSKFVAEMASTWQKPNGLTIVQPEAAAQFLHPLPVERLPGVGKTVSRRLAAHGITRIGDLAKLSGAQAVTILGRSGSHLWRLARGEDPRAVNPDRGRRSRATERTFPIDVWDRAVVEREVDRQVRELSADLAAARERVRNISVRLRWSDFEVSTRSRTLDVPTSEPAKLTHVARTLLAERPVRANDHRPVRMIGITLAGLVTDPAPAQLDLPLENPPTRRP